MTEMDNPALRQSLDPDGAYERNIGLPQQCREAWAAVRDFTLPADYHEVSQIVVAGMGGSAIAGDFLQALAFEAGSVPVSVVRGYTIPAWVSASTLVIACSHSGNTEETLACFAQARERGAKVAVVTTGGHLLEEAKSAGLPTLAYDYPPEPRSGFGHGFFRLLAIGRATRTLALSDAQVESALAGLTALQPQIEADVPEESNPAKALARRLYGKLPLIMGGESLAPAAKRWRTQIEENGKAWAISDEIPELHHNVVVGLEFPHEVRDLVHAVILDPSIASERMSRRYDLTVELLERSNVTVERFPVGGDDSLGGIFRAVYFGNLMSFYLALLYGARPAPVAIIDWLKAKLLE